MTEVIDKKELPGATSVSRCTDESVVETIAALRNERLGTVGPVVDANPDPVESYAPTIDVMPRTVLDTPATITALGYTLPDPEVPVLTNGEPVSFVRAHVSRRKSALAHAA